MWTLPLVLVISAGTAVPADAAPPRRFVPGVDASGPDHAYGFVRGVNNRGQVLVDVRTLWQNGRYTDLGSLGGDYTRAAALNDAGEVVGESNRADGDYHAFLWRRGRMIDLGTLGGTTSTALAIGVNGHVAGNATLPDGSEHVFLWRNGVMTDTGLPAARSNAVHVNAHGQIAFSYPAENFTSKGYFWDRGRATALGSLGGGAVTVVGLNDRGEIAGFGPVASGEIHGFRWWRGRMTDLGTFGWDDVFTSGINNRGQITGTAQTTRGQHAFVWEKGVLKDLMANVPQGVVGESWGINERGDVVGNSVMPDLGRRGTVWRHGRVILLDTVDRLGSQGSYINDRGLVAGIAIDEFDPPRAAVWDTARY
ncbi:hypothetical protein AB0M54_23130 [Actinoplanes sp. NPDC051470]|uniref:hypothetical protein n=1 Tax=Actinoplanes sp. NPDC051470 TaxID=3157224 RepID=UPI0034467B5E